MVNNFDILSNLPQLFFLFCFFVVFVLFLGGGIVLLRARGLPEKVQKGRKILLAGFICLFITLLIILAFYLVSYFLRRGEALKPSPAASKEFPPPFHLGSFPPPPQFIKIDDYYFTGPWSLKDNDYIEKSALFAILCKKNGEYDIIYIGGTGGREKLLKHSQYRCWRENCSQDSKNLYAAIFWTPSDRYPSTKKDEIERGLKDQINPPCPKEESD